jgi:iron complex transport system permease protein
MMRDPALRRQALLPALMASALIGLSCLLLLLAAAIGSTGLAQPARLARRPGGLADRARHPRAARAGRLARRRLLGLAGAVAQGLFRNPLADPLPAGQRLGRLAGRGGGAGALGSTPDGGAWLPRLGLTGAAFVGATGAVLLTLALARGVQHTLRLLLAGVVVGVVLGALGSLVMLLRPEVMLACRPSCWAAPVLSAGRPAC